MRIVVIALALALSGCAGLQAVQNTEVPEAYIYVAANTFNALEITATNYLRLPKCKAGTTPICRSPAATAQIIPAVRSGRAARDELENFTKANPGKLGPSGTYNALVATNNILQSIFTQYNVGAVK